MASAVTINKKVPGKVLALGKLGDEAKKFEQEIRKKTRTELVDILNRQNAILQNPIQNFSNNLHEYFKIFEGNNK